MAGDAENGIHRITTLKESHMKKHQIRKHVVCAAAAVLLTGLSSTVFVSAEPRTLETRISVAQTVRSVDQTPVAQLPAG